MRDNDYEERFSKEPILKLMLAMALPVVAGQLINLLYSVIDRVYIGHINLIGTDALAGVGICATLISLISACAAFSFGGGAAIASIELGKGNTERAKSILNNCLTLLLFFTVILTGVCFPFLENILIACGASSVTLVYAAQYMRIYLAGTVFVLIALGLAPFINAQGHPRYAFAAVALGAITNIVLDPVFIFVLNMGVQGAALATIISQALAAFMIFGFLIN